MRRIVRIPALLLTVAVLAGCGAEGGSNDTVNRAAGAVEACRGHDGVSAFDDDAVICGDQTFSEERGAEAVRACRGREGVAAFDDDIVICGDESFHRVEGG